MTVPSYKALEFISVTTVDVTGDAAQLAVTIEEADAAFDLDDWSTEWPTLDGDGTGPDFVVTYDASQLDNLDAKATWACRVDLASLDWEHPWADATIVAAEAIYHRHRTAEPRWVVPYIEADAARFLRQWNVDSDETMTPLMADRLVGWFLRDVLPAKAECSEDSDPVAALLGEAMEDAKPVSTGIPRLDAMLGGGLHRGLTVIAGNPASGKSALAIQTTLFCANQQRGGVVVYAMGDQGGEKSALLRMISTAAAICDVDGCELGRAGEWDAREVYQGRQAFDRVSKGRVKLTDKAEVQSILSWLRYLSYTKGHVSLAVIDFAQAMTFDERPLAFDAEAASLACRELRAWAHDNNCAILLLSAFSKSASEAHARGAAPQLTDVLGSAELAYSAESVLALTNPHDGSGDIRVADLKHRHGDNEAVTLHLDGQHGWFS